MAIGSDVTPPWQVGLWVEVTDEARGELILKLGTSRFDCILVPDLGNLGERSRHPGPAHTLDRWIAELERLPVGRGPAMLPFNFSDQCTGWLRVSPTHEGLVDVQAGWSLLGQYDFDASDSLTAGRFLPDFRPVRNARIERPLVDVIAAVTACRDELVRAAR
ncbi:hypothetical protein NLX85_29580 [Micromonospora sp. A3M-1-15]|uniref:hypothetical protein n=1 Tax=Micromonospora sp. A3M-1-15 TaxID=2962035 RepID=UPI0020B8FB06|nr:hypothetical protein [Micromonospora sp. A3M-1-15]MCP3787523.1 hypothetical protein [Micromonospora sp. A3M-1-15]